VFENVKGLTLGQHRKFLQEIEELANSYEYDIVRPWQVLNAAHYGVPQHRERLFLYGTRRPRKMPDYPSRTTRPADGRGKFFEAPVGPTARDAMGDLPDADSFDVLLRTDEVETSEFAKPSAYAAELRALTNEAWHLGYVRNWRPSLLTSSMRTEHTDISRRRFTETEGGNTEPISRFYKLKSGGLSNTLRAGTDGARGAFTSPRPIHYEWPRCVTVREMARLHGYPDWFRFNETKWHGARQIGNSVPPPLARAVAVSVIAAIGLKPERPVLAIDLGDPSLLRMTVSEAARFFQVAPPPMRRDKKSGATKRRQVEIEEERLRAALVG
jgi:DNA (cytosine-5)-methyltransferase 1